MGNRSDAELVAQYRRGDESALESIFERYERPLFLFLIGILRDQHQAEDALQETFVEALQRLESVDPDHLRGWLFTVAYHQAMLSRRKRAVQRRNLPTGAPAQVESVAARENDPATRAALREQMEWCRSLLQQLPDVQRDVIRMHLYEGKRFREIAELLGCPLSTALARMHQGLRRLRRLGGLENA